MVDGGGRQVLLETGRRHITADIEAHLGERIREGQLLPVPIEVATQYFAGAMMSVLTWWIDGDLSLAPEEINALFQTLAIPSVQQLVDD